jgi:hypothetical protein
MLKHNQDGAVSGVAISLVFSLILFAAAASFGVWAYLGRQDYKDNVDAKIQSAVVTAKQQESAAKDVQFKEAEKQPLRTYNGPEAFGSIAIKYPKSWSGYVNDKGTSNVLVDGYFYPNIVPAITDQSTAFALRVQVLNEQYSSVVQRIASQQKNRDSKLVPLTVTPYALPKVPKAIGIRVSGSLQDKNNKLGTMVVLPLRTQTIEVWAEGTQFNADFDQNILPNLSFAP